MLGKTLAEEVLEEIERLSLSWDCGGIGAGAKRP